ncbi:MAG: acetoacetate decarboxylase family protein [Candidatus Jordarchaeales archaeon]
METAEYWIKRRASEKRKFFEGVKQQEVVIAGKKGKVPIFYYDARAVMVVLPASARRLRELLPEVYEPATLIPGVGLVAISAFNYRDTDIEPYNELAVAIILKRPYAGGVLSQLRRRAFHVYIHYLPVDTEIALRGGVDYYNYPKFIAEFEWMDKNGEVSCKLSEKGEHILTVHGRKIKAKGSQMLRFYTYLYMDKQPQWTEFRVNAEQYAMSWMSRGAKVELGEHPVAQELRRTLLSTRPLMYMYLPKMQAILYGPMALSPQLMLELLRSVPKDELKALMREA